MNSEGCCRHRRCHRPCFVCRALSTLVAAGLAFMVQFVTALLKHQAAARNGTPRSQLQMMSKEWRLAHREAVFSYLGELSDGIATEPRDDICWVELTATGSRPTVPETLFCDDPHQLFLSAFLLRKRDGKCATLFQNELCDYVDDDVELSGDIFGGCVVQVETVFGPDGPLSRGWPGAGGSMTATVYSGSECTCPNKPTLPWSGSWHDGGEEVYAAHAAFRKAGGCSCELGKKIKLGGLSIGMYDIEFDDETREGDEQPTMSDLLRKLESPSCVAGRSD